jgi:hypothetical protein
MVPMAATPNAPCSLAAISSALERTNRQTVARFGPRGGRVRGGQADLRRIKAQFR